MIEPRQLMRAAALAGILAVSGGQAVPVAAAPADVALLKSYVGEWRGRGQMRGANTETVVCRLSLTEGNQDRVNYNGRCTLAGANLSIAGTLAYVDANRRFEAVMSSNTAFQGVAIGRKQGNNLVFNLRERDTSEGNDMTITSNITLSGSQISVDFNVVDAKSGSTVSARVPFSK
ncbi:hypothetical protein EMQ25_06780 [Arsenicitalea aurantiaca]|uniref:DUF1794 domain-containing protein n=1 Tax=Arsenicitalea aurantiaca TaxID=1783274 RepID=A0A433XFG3_9HYPH|nr:hypothetical protein [Arsenicitalea aurantiaca]RUT32839.1 hypothetical protein EMQ25_06780 [Arsenicitalea aurantiaca]